jgi:gamma-glutamylcyclotransferase (GGCT)/AIG2-like uncharacterized protein YtfP
VRKTRKPEATGRCQKGGLATDPSEVSQPLHYFAYGSNLNRVDMSARCPGAKPLARAALRDWRLTFRGVADIEPAPGNMVQGAIWLLTSADVRSLDRYEGAPSLYARRTVEVEMDGTSIEALTYVMTSAEYLGLPSEWYLGRISQGYRDWGLPLGPLELAVERTATTLRKQGLTTLRPDGRKRLRATGQE